MKPKIAVLELFHSLGIEYCREFAEVDILTSLTRVEILNVIANYDAIIIKSVTEIDSEFLEHAKRLKVIGRAGAGTDNIHFSALEKYDVRLITVPTGNTISAAEFTIYFMLRLCKRIAEAEEFISRSDFRRHLLEGRELGEMTVGLVGLGNVGMAVSERLSKFGSRIIGYSKEVKSREQFLGMGGVLVDSLEVLLAQVDIVSLHVPLNLETKHLLNAETLSHARNGILLVNTARGGLINDDALLDALNSGKVKAAAVDVLCPEPVYDALPGDVIYEHPLLEHPNVFVTPHMAASTEDAQKRIADKLVKELRVELLAEVMV